MFDAERQIRGPESIRSLGLSVSGIQAALRWGHDATYNTYFFKSGSYWRFSPSESRVDSVYPRSMQDWGSIPEDVDATFRDIYGKIQKVGECAKSSLQLFENKVSFNVDTPRLMCTQ